MLTSVIAFLIGVSVGMIIRINRFENHDRQQQRIIKGLTAENTKVKSEIEMERTKRYDAEIYLEEAQGIIGYQRDKLYAITHPAALVEVSE